MTDTYRSIQINHSPPQPVDLAWYADIRFDPSDDAPTYIGLHTENGVATSDTNWKIYKFTYSGSNITRIQFAYGAWDDRATLF